MKFRLYTETKLFMTIKAVSYNIFKFRIYNLPLPASPSGGGAVTFECYKVCIYVINKSVVLLNLVSKYLILAVTFVCCSACIFVIIYSINKSLMTRQANVLLTNASVFKQKHLYSSRKSNCVSPDKGRRERGRK